MIGSGNDLLASLLPRATYEQVYQNGPDTFVAGSAQPVGTEVSLAPRWRARSNGFRQNDAAGEINRKLGGRWLTFQIVLTISSSLFGWSCQCN
jgi:hypothetical protein